MEKDRNISLSKWIWILLGAAAVLLRLLLADQPQLIEQYYSRGLFLGVRWTFDYLLAWLPIPLIYLFSIALIAWIAWKVKGLIRSAQPLGKKIWKGFLSALSLTGVLVFAFLFLWGFNYSRLPIEKQLMLDIGPLSLKELKNELEIETAYLRQLRVQIPGATDEAISDALLPEKLEDQLRGSVENWLQQNGFSVAGKVRAKRIYPRGIFLRFSSSGLYFPWTGEGQVDAGVHPLQLPFVMAHEMGHGMGFGDEGTCNFIAYASCIQSNDPLIQYAGHLNYWRTLAANYLRYEPEAYRLFRAELPAGIIADLNSINDKLREYPDIMPKLRYYAYDTYLKSQGIEEGMLNYNRVVMLVHAWRSKRIGFNSRKSPLFSSRGPLHIPGTDRYHNAPGR